MAKVFLGDGLGSFVTTDDGTRIIVADDPSPYSAEDFAQAILSLLPTGRVWPREPDAVMPQVVAALGPTCERLVARAAGLLADSPAGLLDERLSDWEETLGLPDPCAGPSPTLADRRLGVAVAIAARGGQSVPYFALLAQLLGIEVTVEEFRPFCAEEGFADDPCCEPGWAYNWWVHVAAPDPVLECTLRRSCPAHTRLSFVTP